MKVSLWQAGGNKGTTILILKQLNKLTILTNNCVAFSFSHFLIPLLAFFDQGVLCIVLFGPLAEDGSRVVVAKVGAIIDGEPLKKSVEALQQ